MIPKAELHCHIAGAASPRLVERQARKYGTDVSKVIRDGRFVWSDFSGFLASYDAAAAVFRTAEDYALLAESYLTDLAHDGCLYSEIFVSTDQALRVGLSEGSYIEAIAEGMAQAKAKTGIEARMIAMGLRHLGPEAILRAATYIAANPHPLVTGFGMGGDERLYHPRELAPGFDVARDAGLGITTHAGEFGGPDEIRASIKHLRPSRLGHGVRAIEDPDLVRELADRQIVLELCPSSNIALSVFSSFADHPFLKLRNAGVPVTLNSDDPPHFGTSLAREYQIAATEFGLSQAALCDITATALNAAFVDELTRATLLERLDAYRV